MQDEEKARKERMKEYRRRYREKHGIKEHPNRLKKIAAVVIGVCIAASGSFFAAQSKAAAMVTLEGKPVTEMTEEDVREYLDQREGDLQKKSVHLTADDVDETLPLSKVDAHFDRQRINDALFLVGRTGSPVKRISDVISILRFGRDVPLSIAVDEEKLASYISDMHDQYDQEPRNAHARPDGSGVRIEKERNQITIDSDALQSAVLDELGDGKTDTVDVPVTARKEAQIKEKDLKSIDTVLSYYTTHFDGKNDNRDANIRIAQNALNDTLVPAGKDCSFNKTVGKRTREKGYKDAPVYFDNKVVLDAGGGVCQVSTTLFNAALRAGMIIASRSPHYAPAGYVPVGMDATVADDSLDFAFTNPFTRPVYIYTEMGDAFGNGLYTGQSCRYVQCDLLRQYPRKRCLIVSSAVMMTKSQKISGIRKGMTDMTLPSAAPSIIPMGIITPIRLYPIMTRIQKSSSRREIPRKKSYRRPISMGNSPRML